MILKLLKYFAQYPQKEGVISMFSNGASQFPQYSALLEYVKGLPAPFMPALENLVSEGIERSTLIISES